ncbi:MAG: hypothetical protein GF411_19110 [Candidatus Lokiarchaeota archaeon]|nr:hypothetical protein [Candidatus Lokiarchaeota archaeon]
MKIELPDQKMMRTISKLVQDETGKRQYYRPIYSLHKWWARRAGSHFRSLILLATTNCQNLFVRENGNLLTDESNYFQNHDLSQIVIFDPFMGGGTTLAEANRLGSRVIGCDINPVSYWIVKQTLSNADLVDLHKWFLKLEKSAGKAISELYKTKCHDCGNETAESLYTFWLRTLTCPDCKREVPLFKRVQLNKGRKRNSRISFENPATIFCPFCYEIQKWEGQSEIVCSNCRREFMSSIQSYNRGRFSCVHCNSSDHSMIDQIKAGHHFSLTHLAIEYWCITCDERLYKKPDREDVYRVKKISEDVEKQWDTLVIPKQMIPKGTTSQRWRNHGFQSYEQIFNPRQILAYNHIIDVIKDFPEEIHNAFLTILSNSLEYNNMMTPYNYPHRKLHHLFTYHALPLTTTPVEGNVWGVLRKGAGTFVNCYHRYISAKKYCQQPFDRYRDSSGNIQTRFAKEEFIGATFVDDYKQLEEYSKSALLFCKDSSSIPEIPDCSVDLIVTDPPYFDNIHYSELSNFFYVWLSQISNDILFRKQYVPIENEAIGNTSRNQDIVHYQRMMTKVFIECERVLKDNGKLVFSFHHKKLEAWWAILESLRKSEFRITMTFPIDSEYKVNPHIRKRDSMKLDLNIFCEKRSSTLSEAPSHQLVMEKIWSRIEGIENYDFDWLYLLSLGVVLEIGSHSKVTFEWFKIIIEKYRNVILREIDKLSDR